MSKFTKSISREFEFEGDKVQVTMDRMKRKDAMKLMPYIGEPDAAGNVTMKFKDQMEMVDSVGDLLPKYIKRISGLIDDNGEDVTIETVCEESYFLDLIGDMVGALMEGSFMSTKKEKKLEESSESTTEEQGIPATLE